MSKSDDNVVNAENGKEQQLSIFIKRRRKFFNNRISMCDLQHKFGFYWPWKAEYTEEKNLIEENSIGRTMST